MRNKNCFGTHLLYRENIQTELETQVDISVQRQWAGVKMPLPVQTPIVSGGPMETRGSLWAELEVPEVHKWSPGWGLHTPALEKWIDLYFKML